MNKREILRQKPRDRIKRLLDPGSFNELGMLVTHDCKDFGMEKREKSMIYKGAKLLYAYAEATVPKITVIVRKAYAGAYIALGSRYIGAESVNAWPGAEIASVAPDTAANVIFRREIQAAMDKEK